MGASLKVHVLISVGFSVCLCVCVCVSGTQEASGGERSDASQLLSREATLCFQIKQEDGYWIFLRSRGKNRKRKSDQLFGSELFRLHSATHAEWEQVKLAEPAMSQFKCEKNEFFDDLRQTFLYASFSFFSLYQQTIT